MKSKFFKNEFEKNLWLKLNAENQIESDKHSKYSNRFNIRTMETALQIAENQLEYDEKSGKLRFTLNQLLTLSHDELEKIRLNDHKEWCKKFGELS